MANKSWRFGVEELRQPGEQRSHLLQSCPTGSGLLQAAVNSKPSAHSTARRDRLYQAKGLPITYL